MTTGSISSQRPVTSSVVQGSTLTQGVNTQHRRFRLNIMKHFFFFFLSLSITGRLHREVVECQSLEMLKSCLDVLLGNLLWVSGCEQGC